jgi:glutamate synthase (NADPH/NADH) small chain
VYRVSSAHEEGGERMFSVNTERFLGENGKLIGLRAHEVQLVNGTFEKIEGTDFELEADLVFLAMGFVGPERSKLLTDLGVQFTDRGNVARSNTWETNVPGVFVAGDMGRGQSLIVWAIAEGRSAASAIDVHLEGNSALPCPITPVTLPRR